MAILRVIVQVITYMILLTDLREVTGQIPDCIILKTIIANCSCEGIEGAPIIYCRMMQLTEMPVIGDTSAYNGTIEEFTLSGNQIEHIPDNAFNGLLIRQLDITDNNLNNVSNNAFAGLENSLQVLKISGNTTTPPPFTAIKNLTNLLELNMKNYKILNNDLVESVFLTFTKLKTLILDNWGIISIETNAFDGLGDVTKLVLTNQKLVTLPHEALQTLNSKLEKLEISKCALLKITSYSFAGFKKLVDINLSNNGMKEIEVDSFSGITNQLKFLDLSFNQISAVNLTILQHLTALQMLSLQNIGMEVIPDQPVFLLGKNNLEDLNLANNHISTVSEKVFVSTPNLSRLDLSHNLIHTFDEKAFTSLSKLKHLSLDNQKQNAAATIALPSFANLMSIISINLQESKLDPGTSWDRFKEARNLQSLNLINTGLNVIKDFTFEYSTSLKELDLDSNGIINITQKSLFGLKDSLTSLSLNFNDIQTLDRCIFDNFNTNLKIQLLNNPLHCDCKLRWLRSAQLDKTITLGGMERCTLPLSRQFKDVPLVDFSCNYNYTAPECENYYTTTPVSTTTTAATTTLPRVKIVASILGTTESTITVSWNIPESGRVYIVAVYVAYEELSDPTSKQISDKLSPQVSQYEIRGLKAGVRYEITVNALRVDNQTDSDYIQTPTKSKLFPTTSNPTTEKKSADNEIGIIIGAVVGGIVFLAILVAILYLIFIRRKPQKENYAVQPRTFSPAELPSIGYDSKRYLRKKKDGDKKDQVKVTVISDGKTDNGMHVGRAHVSAGSYQALDPELGKSANHETNHNIDKPKQHSYVNEKVPRSINEYASDIDIRKLPRVPADYRGNATNSGGYYNPSFRNSTQENDPPHSYSEINL